MLTGRNTALTKLATARMLSVALTAAAGSLAAAGSTLAAKTTHVARAAGGRSVTDYAHLRLTSANGNTLVESGKASGTLPGTVQVRLTLRNRTASSSFTIHTSGGTISGHGQGKLKAGKGGWDSFGGWLVVSGGTGRFRGAHGKGGLYGAIYRVTDAMIVQVTGTLYY